MLSNLQIENEVDLGKKEENEDFYLNLKTNLLVVDKNKQGQVNLFKKLIQNLIKEGAIINIENKNGFTPLILASQKGFLDIVKELVQNGAEVNYKNKDGKTALMFAEENNKTDVVNYLKSLSK